MMTVTELRLVVTAAGLAGGGLFGWFDAEVGQAARPRSRVRRAAERSPGVTATETSTG
jgi:hypothetical protein